LWQQQPFGCQCSSTRLGATHLVSRRGGALVSTRFAPLPVAAAAPAFPVLPEDAPPYAPLPHSHDAFLSYRRKDSGEFARTIKTSLQLSGYKVRSTYTQRAADALDASWAEHAPPVPVSLLLRAVAVDRRLRTCTAACAGQRSTE